MTFQFQFILKKIGILSVLVVFAFSCVQTPGPAVPSEHPGIEIKVGSAFFRPAMEFTQAATVTLVYGDGTTPVVIQMESPSGTAARNYIFDNHIFAGSAASHTVKVEVQPWSALKVLNLGFRANDGGNDTGGNGLDLISLHPDGAIPEGTATTDFIRNGVGTETEIKGLSVATHLYGLCFDSQPVEEIDLSGCANLRTLEAYFSNLKKTNFSGCANLVRCSIEATGARYSWRIINGQRVEDASLDLADCAGLRDIRGSADDHDLLKLHPGALNTLWHLCKWGNPNFAMVKIGNEEPQKLDVRRFTVLRQLWVGGSPVLGDLIIDNGVTDSVWGSDCGITSVNTANQTQIYELQLMNNNITSLNVAGCTNLRYFYFNNSQLPPQQLSDLLDFLNALPEMRYLTLSNCGLTQSQVDAVLAAFNSHPIPANLQSWESFSLDLRGDSNASPSAAGLANAQALRNRPVTFTVLVNE